MKYTTVNVQQPTEKANLGRQEQNIPYNDCRNSQTNLNLSSTRKFQASGESENTHEFEFDERIYNYIADHTVSGAIDLPKDYGMFICR